MALDTDLLERARRYEDPDAGISEEFLQPTLGMGRTTAVLARPLGKAAPFGFVICHSFGLEHIHLGRQEVLAARALAAAGFPVLRFHGQGYGDSERGGEVIGLTSHLAEATDAVRLMRERLGVNQVGTVGGRFGGAVAALVADRMDLPAMALWEPSVQGSRFMRDLLRRELLSKLAAGEDAGGASEMQRLRQDLAARGWADIRGFRLSREAHDEVSQVDLIAQIERFSGAALVLALTRTGRVDPSLAKLAQHLESLGARTSLEPVQDQFAAQFGQFRFQTVDGGRGKRDIQLEINERVAAVTAAWAARTFAPSPTTVEVRR